MLISVYHAYLKSVSITPWWFHIIRLCACVCVCCNKYTHKIVHAHIHVDIPIYIYTCIYIYIFRHHTLHITMYIYICVYIYIHVYIYIYPLPSPTMYTYIYICIHTDLLRHSACSAPGFRETPRESNNAGPASVQLPHVAASADWKRRRRLSHPDPT